MRGQVEAFALFLFRHPQTDDDIHKLVGNHRNHAGPDDDGADTPQLADHLGGHVEVADLVGHVVIDARSAKSRIDEDAGQDGAENAADAMDTEDIERVIRCLLYTSPSPRD